MKGLNQYSNCNVIQSLDERIHIDASYENVQFQSSGLNDLELYKIEFTGPFVLFVRNKAPQFSLFVPNYTPMETKESPNRVSLRLLADPKVEVSIIFATVKDVTDFLNTFFYILGEIQLFIKEIDLSTCFFAVNYFGLLPGEKNTQNVKISAKIDGKKAYFKACVYNQLPHIPSKKKHKEKVKDTVFTIVLNTITTTVSQPIKLPTIFGTDAFRLISFEIYQKVKEKAYILCKTPQESMNLVFSIYILSNSYAVQQYLSRIHCSQLNLTNTMPRRQHSAMNSKESGKNGGMNKSNTLKLPQNRNKEYTFIPTNEITMKNNSRFETNSTMIIMDDIHQVKSKSDYFDSIPNQDNFIIEIEDIIQSNDNETQLQQNLMENERLNRSRSNTIKRKNSAQNPNNDLGLSVDIIENNISSHSFISKSNLKQTNFTKELQNIYDEIAKIPKQEAIIIPSFKDYLIELSPPMQSDLVVPIYNQLNNSYTFLKEYDTDFDCIEECEEILSTEKIIHNSKDFYNDEIIVDFDSFFNFSYFPHFDDLDIKNVNEPKLAFLDHLMNVIEIINSHSISCLYSDSDISLRLISIISALFINGFKDYYNTNDRTSFSHNSNSPNMLFIQALDDLCTHIPEIDNIKSLIIRNTDFFTSAFGLTVIMLNYSLLIIVLRWVQKNDFWTHKYYSQSAIISSYNVIDDVIVLLTPIISNIKFYLNDTLLMNENAFSTLEPDFYENIIRIPAFNYYNVNHNSPIPIFVEAINEQFSYGLKNNIMFNFLLDQQREFSFISEVSSFHYSCNEWKDFVEVTHHLKSNSSSFFGKPLINEWISIAIEKRSLHTWLLFLAVHTSISAKYYGEYSMFRDLFRLKYILSEISKLFSQLEN
ncbi:hypothetical protein TRFO_16686 [Tritrichomonas foetus]|uniref:RUN domain-containing protein n=1 Tax=Tritrichomonas foetus TaxID=1144522 RepID=A0A1J4KQN5_9EUKA|nr:hypothetical protein TRFO_16686 [Tritrichomonas foetus]|eukprot:OHT13240.1 hypothetical protein TRFO_16686 [Tritrichomonas foetus]